ncbi:MAG: hypothetical protein JO061_07595 [Acidobacteriaceae bacterium]|nr:hypothetical protein [Acidobacteriaceae bacterium]
MKYRVVFRERSDETGERADNPPSFLEPELEDGMVVDARFVGRLEPQAQHSSDLIQEDDGFLSLSGEIWEYDVADGRDKDFIEALQNSGMVMEFEPLETGDELGIS